VLNRDFVATRPNQKWVTDVTYVMTRDGWAYLSTIKDLYDGFIVAHVFDRNNSIALVVNTIRQAKQKEKVLMDSSSTVTRGTNTLRRRIMMSLPTSITSLPPCPGAEIAGIMPAWKISLDTSKKSIYAISKTLPLKMQNRSSMNRFASITMKGYN
jgi:transposase InsO family protein